MRLRYDMVSGKVHYSPVQDEQTARAMFAEWQDGWARSPITGVVLFNDFVIRSEHIESVALCDDGGDPPWGRQP